MLVVIITLSLFSAFTAGLGWGGNGIKKDYLSVLGSAGMLVGLILTIVNGGWFFGIAYLAIVPGIATSFMRYFSKKYGTGS